ncbi:hypothetical protein AZSI13_24690 [Azospira sp. I13]|uniref:flavodoxin domain-containing protein n=1 Tax=Azospira sp. I13 TaxID=1765050 RepID=UPI000D441D34|nr:flavodoxin domain-containing protein [Azospira sp. I13]GBG03142.1 hypothetical protein AZSI13_24690 [Azospira sp. I13]
MPDTLRLLTAWGATLAYGGLCAAVYLRHRRRRHIAIAPLASQDGAARKPLLVAYASQGGQAEALAGQTARALGAVGLPVRLLALNLLRPEDLAAAEQALFIVSTCGEGDAPDNGALFERRLMAEAAPPDFPHLHVALLSLGTAATPTTVASAGASPPGSRPGARPGCLPPSRWTTATPKPWATGSTASPT